MAQKILSLKQSSNIKGASWDSDTLTLTIEFNKGGVYTYDSVSEDKALAFERSDSPGGFVHSELKGQHQHSKIG